MASGSPQTWTGSSGSWVSTSRCLSLILVSRLTSTRSITSETSNCSWGVTYSADWSRERSSIFRTSRDRRLVSEEMTFRYSRSRSGGMVPSRMPSAKPEIVVMGVLSSWEMLATNSLLRASDWAMLSAMALKASASSPTSSQRPPQLTRVSYSPCPNFRTASAISLRGRVIRREVTELVIKATSMTTTAAKRKMLAKARHISVMLPASAETKTRATTCWPPWMGSSTGAPATYRFSGKIPSRSLMAPKVPVV